jgi:hypothetical protein
MGKLISTVGVGLVLYGFYNIVVGIVGLCILVPAAIVMLPDYIRRRRASRALHASVDATLERNRQWMRDNGREDEITW